MALRDYIRCKTCDCKIVYDGYDNGRERMQQMWERPGSDGEVWENILLCPDCIEKLEAENKRLRETMTKAATDVINERQRQIENEGWSQDHDSEEHCHGELALAAACYAANAGRNPVTKDIWPFAMRWWKPKDPRRDLVRAGALILAEIERLDRGSPQSAGGPQ